MEGLRNPFAIRNGNVILIEDLTVNERGLQCGCKCPACDGEFIARMGDVRVHHFAHSKDACDEVFAYTSGLYKLIHQILGSGSPFYVPALIVSYSFPHNGAINTSNVESYVKIVSERYRGQNRIAVSKGRVISFDSAEIICDSKNHMQAIELAYQNSKMAIKVMPPDTVCKVGTVSPHKDMATLVLDFTNDTDIIQSSDSGAFQNYLLSNRLNKWWRYNPKVEGAYPEIIKSSVEAYQKYQEQQKRLAEEKRLAAQRDEEKQRLIIQQQAAKREQDEKLRREMRETALAAEVERGKAFYATCYEQVKDKFVQQTDQIRDDFGNRWVQCELCGEIKPDTAFSSYGGMNHVNLGQCYDCGRK